MINKPKVMLLTKYEYINKNYIEKFLLGIANYCHLRNPWIFYGPWLFQGNKLFTHNHSSLSEHLNLSHTIRNWGANGILILVQHPERFIDDIVKTNIPAVIMGLDKPLHGSINVVSNNKAIGIMAAEYLLQKGFKQFAYFGRNDYIWSNERSIGFTETIIKAGGKIHLYAPSSQQRHSWAKEEKTTINWLKSLPKPIGIMASDDLRGQNLLEACSLTGFKVPDTIAVIGVDNDEIICGLSNPQLSSITRSIEKAGHKSAELLDKLMAGEKLENKQIIINPICVITRQSTNILAVDDEALSKALQFIKTNSDKPIQVDEVADYVGLSRRSLEIKFRTIFGKSIHKEIARERIERAARLITETNMPIAQIARELNYSDAAQLFRPFLKQKNMTPRAYRLAYSKK